MIKINLNKTNNDPIESILSHSLQLATEQTGNDAALSLGTQTQIQTLNRQVGDDTGSVVFTRWTTTCRPRTKPQAGAAIGTRRRGAAQRRLARRLQ